MVGPRRIEGDMTNIGEQAKPPFAVLPDPSELFLSRAKRLAVLAPGHELEPYLDFLSCVTESQNDVVAALPPPAMPPADRITQALAHGMPPLSRATMDVDDAMVATVAQLAESLGQRVQGGAAATAVEALKVDLPAHGRERVAAALKGDATDGDVARRVLVLAGLQVHFARLAAQLAAPELKPVANGACPSCGSPPLASTIVGWPKAYNTRYCTCSLCSTMWNVVRVTCVLCGATDGVTFRSVEGQPETVKAETCDSCRSYVKVVYQVKDTAIEAACDDVATVGLDMLLAEEGWKRAGQNPFLLGY